MRFSIITPSFRNSNWLKRCVASVADQEVEHEHIVQDSCSDDGTQEWLPNDPRVTAVIEKDSGMYDAVNRGYRRARGELLAYINCDEQYLPGTLRKVSDYFDAHPEVDVVFGDTIVVDESGQYICERKALVPQYLHSLVSVNLSFLTAGAFLRRRVVMDHQLFFNPTMRIVGDAEWTARLVKSGVRMATLGEFVAVFAETGHNLSWDPKAMGEKEKFFASAPKWAQMAAPMVVAHFRLRRLLAGAYSLQPHDYAIYTKESPDQRRVYRVENPTYRWRR